METHKQKLCIRRSIFFCVERMRDIMHNLGLEEEGLLRPVVIEKFASFGEDRAEKLKACVLFRRSRRGCYLHNNHTLI